MTRGAEDGRRNLHFMAVVAARLTSHFGSFLSMMALNVYMLELTESAAWIGLAMAVKVLSGIAATPLIGYAVDRLDRKRLMIASDLVLSASMLSLVLAPSAWVKGHIVLVMALLGVFAGLFDVALSAATPVILGSRDTLRANSWLVGGRNLVAALSGLCAAAAGCLFKGYDAIFVFDALTYLFSAAVLLALPIRTAEARSEEEGPRTGFLERMRAGIAEIEALPNARVVALFLAVLLLDAFASASHNIGWPVFSRALRPSQPMFFYGFILFFYAFGNVAGIYQLNRLACLRRCRPEALYLGFTAVMSVGMILTFQTRISWFIGLSAALAGIGDGTYQTYFTTYMQQVPDAARGKIFALSGLALRTGFSLGLVAVPLSLGWLSLAATAALFHGVVLLAVAAAAAIPKAALAPRAEPAAACALEA